MALFEEDEFSCTLCKARSAIRARFQDRLASGLLGEFVCSTAGVCSSLFCGLGVVQ